MKTVLIVDDHVEVVSMLSQFMSGANWRVLTATSQDDALEHIDRVSDIDAAIVDFWLGDEDSLSLIDEIVLKRPKAQIVLTTGAIGPLSVETKQALGNVSGAVSFLQKPFRHAELLKLFPTS